MGKAKTKVVTDGGAIDAERIRTFVDRLRSLEMEKKTISEEIAGVLKEAEEAGLAKKVLKDVVKRSLKDRADVEKHDEDVSLYEAAIQTSVPAAKEPKTEEKVVRLVPTKTAAPSEPPIEVPPTNEPAPKKDPLSIPENLKREKGPKKEGKSNVAQKPEAGGAGAAKPAEPAGGGGKVVQSDPFDEAPW